MKIGFTYLTAGGLQLYRSLVCSGPLSTHCFANAGHITVQVTIEKLLQAPSFTTDNHNFLVVYLYKYLRTYLCHSVALTNLGGEREPLFKWKGAWPEEAPPQKKNCGRMWSGGAREHYASEISDRKLP